MKAVFRAFLTGAGGSVSGHSYDTLPDNDDITLTVHGTADTYGDWVEVVSTVGSSNVWFVGLHISAPTVATDYKVDVGTGASGSETRRATFPFARTDTTAVSDASSLQTLGLYYSLPFPIYIPNGTRLASREKVGATAGAVNVVTEIASGLSA